MNDTETALYTRTASPSLAWTLTSITTTTTVLSFHKSFLRAPVSTTHSPRAGAAREKEENKKWRRCRSHRSRKLRWRCIRNHNRVCSPAIFASKFSVQLLRGTENTCKYVDRCGYQQTKNNLCSKMPPTANLRTFLHKPIDDLQNYCLGACNGANRRCQVRCQAGRAHAKDWARP